MIIGSIDFLYRVSSRMQDIIVCSLMCLQSVIEHIMFYDTL